MARIEDKKKIEENVLKLIEESKNSEICSLYDVYLDTPMNFTEQFDNSQFGSTVKYF